MTWEQKMEAMMSLQYDISLRMRKPGDWYAAGSGLEIGGDGMLASPCGNGKTPMGAVENLWLQLTSLPSDRYIVRAARLGIDRKHVRWNGYMWAEVPR